MFARDRHIYERRLEVGKMTSKSFNDIILKLFSNVIYTCRVLTQNDDFYLLPSILPI